MLEIAGLTKSFAGFVAVADVSLTIETRQIAAVIGPTGAGKSALFNLITGHLRPDSGRILLDGRDITGVQPHQACRMGLGRSFQRTNIFPKLSVSRTCKRRSSSITRAAAISGREYEPNRAGFIIHSAIHMARPDARCVL